MIHLLSQENSCYHFRMRQSLRKLENCTGTGIAGSPRGARGTRGYGDKVHGLTAGMGPITRGHRGDGFNNLRGHRGHGVRA